MKTRKGGSIRRTLATLLAIALCIGLLPGTVLAENDETPEEEEKAVEEIVIVSEDDVGETDVEAGTQEETAEAAADAEDVDLENDIQELAVSEEPDEEEEETDEEESDVMTLDADAFKTEVESAPSGETVILDEDITVNITSSEDYITVENGITIDLDGHTIYVTSTATSSSSGNHNLFRVNSDETVTLKNGTIDGTPESSSAKASAYVLYANENSGDRGDVVIDSLTVQNFNSYYGTVYTNYCDLTVTGSTFKDNTTRGIYSEGGTRGTYYDTVTISGTEFNNNVRSNANTTAYRYGGGAYIAYAKKVDITDSTFTGNTAHYSGGGCYIYISQDITVSGNTFTQNTASNGSADGYSYGVTRERNGGGGFTVFDPVGELTISGNTITENWARSFGGGFYVVNDADYDGVAAAGALGNIHILDNTITNNTIDTYQAVEDGVTVCYSNGGGLAVIDMEHTHGQDIFCEFIGNKVDNNISTSTYISPSSNVYCKGGGMSMLSYGEDLEFRLYSGTISGNTATMGGGIDFTFKDSSVLRTYGSIITGNDAFRGGGIFECPTSKTDMYETFGGAIYGNTTSQKGSAARARWSDGVYHYATGDDIRYEGPDSDILSHLLSGYEGEEEDVATSRATVSSRALGGSLVDWYTDGTGLDSYTANRYRYLDSEEERKALLIPLEEILMDASLNGGKGYKNTNKSFGLHAELSDEAIELAEAEAELYITDNLAYMYGGGIASNALVTLGYNEDVDLALDKTFQHEDGTELTEEELPEYIDVTLVRIDEDGTEHELETVRLSAENDWKYEFDELEHQYITVGEEDEINYHDYSYTVKEIDVKEKNADEAVPVESSKYKQSIEVKEYDDNNDGMTDFVEISMENKEKSDENTPTELLNLEKTVEGTTDTDEFEFKVTLYEPGDTDEDGNLNYYPYKGDVSVAYTIDGETTVDTLTFDEGEAYVTIPAAGSASLEIGDGMQWWIEEVTTGADSTTYTIDDGESKEGTSAEGMVGSANMKVSFTNSYNEGKSKNGNPDKGNPDKGNPDKDKPRDGIPDNGNPNGGGTPKTGDTNHIALWLVLLAASAVACGSGIYMKKRKNRAR